MFVVFFIREMWQNLGFHLLMSAKFGHEKIRLISNWHGINSKSILKIYGLAVYWYNFDGDCSYRVLDQFLQNKWKSTKFNGNVTTSPILFACDCPLSFNCMYFHLYLYIWFLVFYQISFEAK